MPLSQVEKDLFNGQLNSMMDSKEFGESPNDQKGLYVNQFVDQYSKANNITNTDDLKSITDSSEKNFTEYKNARDINRLSLPYDQLPQYGPQLNVNPQDTKDQQIQSVKDWEINFTNSASKLRPAEADDIKTQVGQIADNQIRSIASKGDWYAHELTDRTVGGAIKPLFDLFNGSRWFDSSYFGRTNPEYDSDFSSQVFSGIGTVASLVAIGAATGGLGDAVGIGRVAGATIGNLGYFNVTMMHDAYKTELDRSGDPQKALDSALFQIPAASIQAIGDMAMMRLGLGELIPDLKGFKNQWLAATTDEAKQAILKKAIPTIGQEAIRGGLIGAGGMIAQDQLSGLGSYYATGDESYLKTFDQTIKSGAVGGVLGLLTGAIGTGHAQDLNRDKIAKSFSDIQTNQKAVFDLLQKGDYKGVQDLYANNFITKTAQPEFVAPQGQPKTPTKSSYTIGDINFSRSDIDRLKNTPEPSPDAQNYDNLKAEYDRKQQIVKQIEDGTLPTKTSSMLTVPDNNDIGSSPGPHNVELEDGSNLKDHITDPSQKVVYVNDDKLPQRFTRIGVDHGELTLVPTGENQAVFAVQTQDGTFQKGREKFKTSSIPKEGWTPVLISDKVSDGNPTERTTQVLPVVKAADLFVAHPDFTHVETINKKNGDPKAVIGQDTKGNKIITKPDTELGKQLLNQEADKKAADESAEALKQKKQLDALKQSAVDENRTFFAEQAPVGAEPNKETTGRPRMEPNKETLYTEKQFNDELDAALGKMDTLTKVQKGMRIDAMEAVNNLIKEGKMKEATPEGFIGRIGKAIQMLEAGRPLDNGWENVDIHLGDIVEPTELGNKLSDIIKSSNKTAKDALDAIAGGDNEFSKLAKELIDTNPKGLDATLKQKDSKEENGRSTYHPKEHEIRFSNSIVSGSANPRIVIHEIIHALTSREMQAQLVEGFKSLKDSNNFPKGSKGYLDNLQKIVDSKTLTKPVEDIVKLYLKGIKDTGTSEAGRFYGFGSPEEFIAEVFSSQQFQEHLNKLKGFGDNKTIWESIKDAIREMLGGLSVKVGSILDEVLDASKGLITQKDTEAFKSHFKESGYDTKEQTPKTTASEFKDHIANDDYKTTKDFFDALDPKDQTALNKEYNGDALGFAQDHFGEEGPSLLGDNKNINEDGIPLSGHDDAIQARKDALGVTKDLIKDLKRLKKGGANYQPLINKEVAVTKQFREVDYNFLSNQDLASYTALLNNFTESRSKTKQPTFERVSVQDLDNKLIDLKKKADQGKFDYIANDNPEAFGAKTFADFDNDIDSVNQYLQSYLNSGAGDLSGAGASSQIRQDTESVIRDIQDELRESGREQEIKDIVYGSINSLKDFDSFVASASPETKELIASSPQLEQGVKRFIEVVKEHGNDADKIIGEIFNYGLNTDPSELTNLSDVLKQKYLLQAFRTDGYFPFLNTFVSAEMRDIIHTKGIPFEDGYSKKSKFIVNIESTDAMRSRVAPTKEASHFIQKLGNNLHDSYNRAQRAHIDFLIPATTEIARKWQSERGGKPFNDIHLNQMGILASLRQRYLDETPNEALRRNLEWLDKSANNHINSNDKSLRKAAVDQKEFISRITKDMNLDSTEDQRPLIEKNFSDIKELGPEALGYIKDMQKIFEIMTPLAKSTSEFAYGKEFHEIENYFPSFSLPVGGSFEDNKGILYNGDIDLSTPVESFMIGSKGTVNIDSSRKGMSSINLRERIIPEGRRLVLNINNMIMNRGRLNLLDHFTALRRREMSNVLKNKQFSRFLGDVHVVGDKEYLDQRGRTDLLRRSYNQEWGSQVQANSYLGTWQTVLNGLTRRFSVAKLASLYRAPVHIVGNLTSYLVTNPGKTFDLMKSFSAMLEAHRNPEYRNFLDKLFFETRKRDQQFNMGDVAFDRSTTIHLSPEGDNVISQVAQSMKESKVFQGVAKVDAVVQKALFAPLKWSDKSSGNAIMLTEFLHNERERLNNPTLDFKDLKLNPESTISYNKSLTEMERHVSISDASRRGLWMNNTNPSISLLRNLTMAFAGKKIMNATNFTVAMHNLVTGSITQADKAATWRFMGAIMAQTAAFQVVKWTIQNMTGQAILNIVKNNDDDSLESFYRKQAQSDTLTPRQKVMLEQEISTRRKIRAALNNAQSKLWDGKLLAADFAKDILPNMFIATSVLSGQQDGIIHLTYDKYEQVMFEKTKQAEIERLGDVAKQAKENNNISLYAKAKEKISDMESQKAMQVINQHENYQPLTGIIGEFLNSNYEFGKAAVNSVMGTHEIYPSDIVNIMSAYGIGETEVNSFFRLQKQITEPKDQQSKQLQQKLQKLQKTGNNY